MSEFLLDLRGKNLLIYALFEDNDAWEKTQANTQFQKQSRNLKLLCWHDYEKKKEASLFDEIVVVEELLIEKWQLPNTLYCLWALFSIPFNRSFDLSCYRYCVLTKDMSSRAWCSCFGGNKSSYMLLQGCAFFLMAQIKAADRKGLLHLLARESLLFETPMIKQ